MKEPFVSEIKPWIFSPNMKRFVGIGIGVSLFVGCVLSAHARDVSPSYIWSPVRLGAGGFVSGFVTHPKDASVRYCRTDVGNAYRWDSSKKEWMPMIVRSGKKGLPLAVTRTPQSGGVVSLGIDPSNPAIVYLAYQGNPSADVAAETPAVPGSIYKSIDGGRTLTVSDLRVAMSPNGDDKSYGERITVDPISSASVFYGSQKDGLWHSADGGQHWIQVTGDGGPDKTADVSGILFAGSSLYAVCLNGSIYQSSDGGRQWKNVSAGTGIDGKAAYSASDPSGAIYVIENNSRRIWKYLGGTWSTIVTDVAYEQNINGLAVDPAITGGQRLYVIGGGGLVARTDDGGKTWNQWGNQLQFAGLFGWLPQAPGYRSTAGIALDRNATLWVPEGNEGMLSYVPTGKETWNSAKWTISSKGIEEFVTHDVILPPGGGALFAVEDSTALYSPDPARFVAKQATLQDQLISNGSGLAYCPNAPAFIVGTSADVNHTYSGATYSGYSTDGGRTWTRFGSAPPGGPIAGSIAVSRRAGWGLGSDHLVYYPSDGDIPYYSQDGGKTWSASTGYPSGNGYWTFSLKQRELAADPFIADRFYCEGTWKGGFYVSMDGGKSWQLQAGAGLPQDCHHGQLAVNRNVRNDLWFADGWEGATAHGLWHSVNGGTAFSKVLGIDHALTLALGAGRGQTGDSPYTVYFYGKLTSSTAWGVFRSTNSGKSWDRIAFYPTGLVDQPTCMAASWDRFSRVFIGFGGNSFVYGQSGITPQRKQHH